MTSAEVDRHWVEKYERLIECYRHWVGEQFSAYDSRAINGNTNAWQRAQAMEDAMLKFEELFPSRIDKAVQP